MKPRKLFVLIGTNDISNGSTTEQIAENISRIVSRVQEKLPDTRIYLQAVFPTRHLTSNPNTEIQALNTQIQSIAANHNCKFIDLYPLLLDSDGELAEEFTIDGLHLSKPAVSKWMAFVVPYLDE